MECFTEYEPPTNEISFHFNNEYQVFLNFRGSDVRKAFVDHLYESLSASRLWVFLDSEELEKGESINTILTTTIQKSDILIPIFSERYAESTWCLEEAV
ncbi:hypothetical protein SUGI_1184050 [Cryptomeria japonica]|nr:hypothetical protein SUGI_1184050 [Cryptomeria japonica]